MTSKAYNPREMVPLRALDSSYWGNEPFSIMVGDALWHMERETNKHTEVSPYFKILVSCKKKKKCHPPTPQKMEGGGCRKKNDTIKCTMTA